MRACGSCGNWTGLPIVGVTSCMRRRAHVVGPAASGGGAKPRQAQLQQAAQPGAPRRPSLLAEGAQGVPWVAYA